MQVPLDALTAWMPKQRWFTETGQAPSLRVLADIPLAIDEDATADQVRILVVADDAPARPIVYQVPVVVRGRADSASPEAAVIAVLPSGQVIVDGPHDAAFTGALLRAVGPDSDPGTASVLTGEQSNTSIVYRRASGHPIICKVFRQLSAGLNPDIELQSALTAAGSRHVPDTVGSLEGAWQDPADEAAIVAGSLAFAQEFFPGVEDAWRVALRAAESGDDFTEAATALGRTTAEVHLDLARRFPAPEADDARRAAITQAWQRRLSIAIAEVPRLRPHERAIRERYAAADQAEWPALQRIHGDYHLGQVLQVPERGWVLLDFEGEPMRPMVERREPDLALRDIAGMLRSFDYVAGSLEVSGTVWAAAARGAFLSGYAGAAGTEPVGPLLDALELDKAVYEAIYEARYRPAWLPIPLAGIDRLLVD